LAAISSWLQRNFNAPANEVDARDRGNATHAIATRLWANDVERVTGAQCGDQGWGAELKCDATGG
jgi:hypothetical protein